MTEQWLLVGGVVLATIAADYLQASHMQTQAGSGVGQAAASFFRQPKMMVSIIFMAISFGSFVLLLRTADLSFAVPATASSYVFETAMAQWILREKVGRRRWAASLLIACGVALLAL
ncbi:MAG: EamA family transporter [Bryobacteraceae bacterium]|nr:EamA family transporter [Bryobacteraceae bacterium]